MRYLVLLFSTVNLLGNSFAIDWKMKRLTKRTAKLIDWKMKRLTKRTAKLKGLKKKTPKENPDENPNENINCGNFVWLGKSKLERRRITQEVTQYWCLADFDAQPPPKDYNFCNDSGFDLDLFRYKKKIFTIVPEKEVVLPKFRMSSSGLLAFESYPAIIRKALLDLSEAPESTKFPRTTLELVRAIQEDQDNKIFEMFRPHQLPSKEPYPFLVFQLLFNRDLLPPPPKRLADLIQKDFPGLRPVLKGVNKVANKFANLVVPKITPKGRAREVKYQPEIEVDDSIKDMTVREYCDFKVDSDRRPNLIQRVVIQKRNPGPKSVKINFGPGRVDRQFTVEHGVNILDNVQKLNQSEKIGQLLSAVLKVRHTGEIEMCILVACFPEIPLWWRPPRLDPPKLDPPLSDAATV